MSSFETGRGSAFERRLARRYRAEALFRFAGLAAIGVALGMLVLLLGSVLVRGLPSFVTHVVTLDIELDADRIDPKGDGSRESLRAGDHAAVVKSAIYAEFPEVEGRSAKRRLSALISRGGAYAVQDALLADRRLIGRTVPFELPLSDDAALYLKGHVTRDADASMRRLSDDQLDALDRLLEDGRIASRFDWGFLSNGDSREPELAGVGGALRGSLFTLLVTLLLSFPVGVAAAIYLQEFAPTNRLTDFIEVNINNLAAVPSIVYGLLGLAVFLGLFGLTRSAPLVGGMVLSLMTLPTIIIATRASLLAVPPSLREAATGVGASPVQVVFHHVLPQALPGVLTGTIIGMARSLGETAPLLMIGMVAFVADVPQSWTDPATVLPVQIFLWSDAPERAFAGRTAAGIIVLLAFLFVMNGLAVWLRRRFERPVA
jgi:phosphate transport system permease protein